MLIKEALKLLVYNPYRFVNKNKELIKVGESKLTKSFRVKLPSEASGLRIKIGDGCILMNTLVLETLSGRVEIGDHTWIGGGTNLISAESISIGSNVMISWHVTIYDHDGNALDYRERRKAMRSMFNDWESGNYLRNFDWGKIAKKGIKIEDDAWIGFGAVVLKGVTVGRGAIIAAHSVVTKDVPPFTVAAGNPARVVKELKDRY